MSIRTGEDTSSDRETRNLENFEVFLFLDESFYKVRPWRRTGFYIHNQYVYFKQHTCAEALQSQYCSLSSGDNLHF